ncbi:MAG TPA: alcohol dehydrogenase catalytic domain-containing protein [Clostridia bacterium]
MKAWIIDKPGSMSLQEITENETLDNTAKVKLTLISLSIFDAKIYNGELAGVNYPCIPGRHAVGLISEIQDNVAGLKRGQRVFIDPNLPCNNCYACKTDRPWKCDKMKVMGLTTEGLLRDFVSVPVSNLYQIPSQMTDSEAQFIEHTSIAVKAFNELKPAEGEHIVIIGASIMGIIMAQLALYYQAVPILLDHRQERLDIAANLGIYYTINTAAMDAYERIKQITGGRFCESSIYLANANDNIQNAFNYASAGGKVAIVGGNTDAEKLLNGSLNGILTKQLSVIGISNGQKQIPAAINVLAKKAVDVSAFTAKEFKFEDAEQGLKEFISDPSKYHKILIKV